VLVGANLTDTTVEPPAEIVCGTVNPLTLNPVACTESPEMVTDDEPEFFIVTEIVRLEPTVTDPKLPGDGLKASVWASAATVEKPNARKIRHAYAKYRRHGCRCWEWRELVPGETAKKRFCNDDARSP
jgi:hypothetical protein